MKILLIQLKRIGDLILTAPAVAALREKYPRAHISLIVSAGARELLPALPGLDQIYIARGNLSDAAQFASIALQKFDYCLDFTRTDRSAFLTLLSAARERVTSDFARIQSELRARSYNEFVECSLRDSHTVDYHLALLEPLGIRDASQVVRLRLPSSALQGAEQVLAKSNIAGDFLLVHPGSARKEKFWEPERWSDVIDFASGLGLPCILTGGRSAMEREHIAQIRSRCAAPFVDLSGRLDLLALAALIQRARLLTTVDSAPMHLAAAMQTPQVVLFGPTNPLHWRPRFSPAMILQAGKPEPLTEFSPDQKPVPMNEISTEQVIDAMRALLAGRSAASV
jgi:lipopolysaccharide heptosyltransferase III